MKTPNPSKAKEKPSNLLRKSSELQTQFQNSNSEGDFVRLGEKSHKILRKGNNNLPFTSERKKKTYEDIMRAQTWNLEEAPKLLQNHYKYSQYDIYLESHKYHPFPNANSLSPFQVEEELSKAFNDEQNESLILNKPSGKLPFDADRELVENLDRWIIQRSEQSPDPKDLKSPDSPYRQKIRIKIKKEITENHDTLIRSPWVQRNALIKSPSKQLQTIIKQRRNSHSRPKLFTGSEFAELSLSARGTPSTGIRPGFLSDFSHTTKANKDSIFAQKILKPEMSKKSEREGDSQNVLHALFNEKKGSYATFDSRTSQLAEIKNPLRETVNLPTLKVKSRNLAPSLNPVSRIRNANKHISQTTRTQAPSLVEESGKEGQFKEKVINYEINMELSHQQLLTRLKRKKMMIEKLRNRNSRLYEDIAESKAVFPLFSNTFQRLNALFLNTRDKKLMELETKTNSSRVSKQKNTSSKFKIEALKQKTNEKENRDESIRHHQNLITRFHKDISITNKKLRKVNAKCRALRQEIQAIREEQNNHYHQILQYGTDTRQEGLVWVLKAIWYLDSNINLSKLPKFLDPLSIHYLFTYARKDMKMCELKKSLYEKRLKIRHRRLTLIYSKLSTREHLEKKQKNAPGPSMTNINSRIHFVSQTTISKGVAKNKMTLGVEKSPELDDSMMNDLDSIKSSLTSEDSDDSQSELSTLELEKQIETLRAELKEMKKKELNRISKIFLNKTYFMKNCVRQETVLSALVGIDRTKHELDFFLKEREDQRRMMLNNKTFNFGGLRTNGRRDPLNKKSQ